MNGHLHKEEEDGKIGGDRHSDVELHCLHLTKQETWGQGKWGEYVSWSLLYYDHDQTGKMRSG